MMKRLVVATLASLSMVTGALAWDGARAYHLQPEGSSDLSLTMTLLHGKGTVNLGGDPETSELDVGVVSPAYRHTFDLFGNAGTVLIGIPLGGLTFSTPSNVINANTDFAQGDMFIGGVWGLVGMPSLEVMDYVQHQPGFQASAAARLFLPTGDYDSGQSVSLGQNRWSLQASLPMAYVLGDSMVDPNLTTFEIRPLVHIFGDNDDPFGGGGPSSKAPIFGVEGHITRNFGNSIWAGLDGYYEIGGENSLNGIAQDDELETLALGATLGLVFSPSLAMRISYRELVYSNVPDSSGRTFEVATAFLF
jgi:hypothetical protein